MKLKTNARKLGRKLGLTLAVGIVLPATSFAQDSGAPSTPYSVSGHCASQGSWTRAALSQANEIKQVIMKLKDNPACNGLKTSMETNLTSMEKSLAEIDGLQANGDQRTQTLSQLPEEIAALRTFARHQSPFKTNIMDLLVGKTIQMSALSSAPAKTGGASIESVAAITNRARAATAMGLQLFNNTMSSFQEAQQGCLESGQTAAVVASGMVKILNAFALSNSGLNNQVALSVQKFSQYLARDKKYVDALRSLNDAEFISSMSCLMEITTDGYCDALDAQFLFRELTESQNIKVENVTNKTTGKVQQKIVGLNENFDRRMSKGPLAGYYILTRQVPIVTEWLQKVQMSTIPQAPSESAFKVEVSMNSQEHNNQVMRIQGLYNFGRDQMRDMDFKSKQGQAYRVLENVASMMVGSFQTNSQYENFFTRATSEIDIYFGLIGVPVPDEVSGRNGQAASQYTGRPSNWLKDNYRTLPVFNDPDKLVELIGQNMERIFEASTRESIKYFNRNFIVDKPQVVADSLLGLSSNVRDALVNIDQYLANVQLRFNEEKDPSYYSMIVTTRGKIGKVLKRYRELRNQGLKILEKAKADPQFTTLSHTEIDEELKKVGNDLLQEVYTQFEVQTARTGMLSNRIGGIVLQDYTMSLKRRDQFGEQFQDIMLASGYSALNSMINMGTSDLSKMKIDLAQAMNIYKTDIDALENIVSGVYVRNIFNNKIRISNENITEQERNRLAYEWSYKMAAVQFPGENANFLQRWARGHMHRFMNDVTPGKDAELFGVSTLDKLTNPVKQIWSGLFGRKGKIIASPTSEFDTNKTMVAYYCAQTLAFANFTPYWALCQDAELESPLLTKNVRDAEIKKIMQSYLAVPYKDKAYENLVATKAHPTIDGMDRARNMQARICALRDYHRRNKIAEVTSAMRQDGDTYENPFLKDLAGDLVNQVPVTHTEVVVDPNSDSDGGGAPVRGNGGAANRK